MTYRIVVGYDGSEGGARALLWAVGEAHSHGGSVQAIMAYERSAAQAAVPAGPDVNPPEEILARGIEGVRGRFLEVPIATEAVLGSAAQKLAEASKDADLLVVGRHGHGHPHDAVLGTVSEGCTRNAHCPVVVVPTPYLEPSPRMDLAR
jgi:nucleotide-binding universal stress UspA family protein